jgi:hypothetical protein
VSGSGDPAEAHLETITRDIEVVDIHELAAEDVAEGDSQAEGEDVEGEREDHEHKPVLHSLARALERPEYLYGSSGFRV